MFRNLTTTSVKQGQRVTSKAFQHNPPQPSRFINTSVTVDNSNNDYYNSKFTTGNNNNNNNKSFHPQYRNLSYSRDLASASASASTSTSSPAPNAESVRKLAYTLQEATAHLSPEEKPYYKQLLAFDECTAHNASYDLATGKISGGVGNFWNAVHKIMPLYRELILTGELNDKRMTELVSLLRNGLRIHRLELSKLRKNLDKDANNPLKEIHYFLTLSIREVSQNVLEGLVPLNSHGLTHLFKAYKDLGFTVEAVHMWETGKNDPKLYQLFTSESVLGSVFPFLVESGDFNYDEINDIYNRIKLSKSQGEKIHSELQVGMIRACLYKGFTEEALKIFQQLTSDVYSTYTLQNIQPPINVKSYMTMAHLSFIGFCKDIPTADVFFKGAVNEEMPYLTPLQLNFIKKYISNIWNISNDYLKVKEVWLTTWRHYELKGTSNSSVSSSLNDSFLSIFFEKYPVYTNEAFEELRSLINDYNSIRSIDEPFINVLLSKSTIWQKTQVFESIIMAAESYNFQKTNVFYRCALKASGSVDLSIDKILILFRQLLELNLKTGYTSIAHADWVALRDSTINSDRLLQFSNPNERIDLYFKLWKICSTYFLNLDNFKNYINKDIKLNQNYSRVFQEMPNIDTSDINIPEISYFRKNNSIENYIRYAY